MKSIILASASPRRISLLKDWGLKFEVIASNIEEKIHFKKPSKVVKELSLKKALNISKKHHNRIIIAADTIVVINGEITGKPKNFDDSKRIIKALNNNSHKVYTGVAIIDNSIGKISNFYDVASVKMKNLPEVELEKLFGKHMDKAGAYAIQDKDDAFVKKINGDYYTIVGLPYHKLKEELKNFGIKIKLKNNISGDSKIL